MEQEEKEKVSQKSASTLVRRRMWKATKKAAKCKKLQVYLNWATLLFHFLYLYLYVTNQTLVVQIHHGLSMASELCHASEVIGLGIAEPQLCRGEEKIPWNFGIALCLICWLLETYTRWIYVIAISFLEWWMARVWPFLIRSLRYALEKNSLALE